MPWVSEAQVWCLNQILKVLPLLQHLPANPPFRTLSMGVPSETPMCRFQINHL